MPASAAASRGQAVEEETIWPPLLEDQQPRQDIHGL